ncbi:MAG: sensor histidine kinase [Actinobacteria bacterium]|nr:sensor histidine kinase [Actinomycetota bacterium]
MRDGDVIRETTWKRNRHREVISVPLEVGGERVGILWLGGKLDRTPFSLEELDNVVALSAQVSVSLRNAQLMREVQEKSERLRRLAQGVSTAQEEERIRVSRELHDGLAPHFLDIIYRLDGLRGEALGLPGAEECVEEIREKAREGMRDLRRIVSDLRPSSLEVLGLSNSLSSYLERFGVENGVRTSFHAWGSFEKLDPYSETTLFRVAQEALSNVARHAHAGAVRLSLGGSDGHVELRVEDDGVGFRWEEIRERMAAGECLGLKGMMERAELSQGVFHVETAPGMGTRLVFDMPLRQA